MGVDCDFPLPCKCGCCSSEEERYTSMQEEIEDAWEAARMAAQEPGWLHEVLTQCGVPEQIPPFKVALAPAKARVLYLSARCNQLFDEAVNLRERLDQFEAHTITVKSALDDRADRDALREALREIVGGGCELDSGDRRYENDRWTECPDTLKREYWCGSCLARRALAASEVPK